jgi:recombination protein RecT
VSTAPAIPPGRKAFPALIDASRERIAAILPDGVSPDRFAKVALVAFAQNPELARCDPNTVLLCVMQAAELGLEIGKPLDLCHLVPFKGQCTLILDYKGMLDLARRSGDFAEIGTRLIYARDEFSLEYDPSPVFRHRPHLGEDRGEVTHAYAYARLRSGALVMEVMTTADVEAIRRGANSSSSPAWRNHWGEMARKAPLKRLLKRQARSPHLARAIDLDDAGYDLDRMRVSTAPRQGTRAAALADRLAAQALPPPEFTMLADEGLLPPEGEGLPSQEEIDADAGE